MRILFDKENYLVAIEMMPQVRSRWLNESCFSSTHQRILLIKPLVFAEHLKVLKNLYTFQAALEILEDQKLQQQQSFLHDLCQIS